MLSDEEKKEYEAFKYYYQTNTEKGISYIPDYMCENVLNLIEKQSKEIEELKSQIDEHVYNGCDYELCNKKWEDKIKAKIEELDDGIKRDMINYDKVKDESWKLAIHRSMAQKIEIKKVLQSLLEKE